MKITCQVCGSLNKKDNEFCNSCGVKLSMDNDEEETINLTVSSHSVDLCGLLTVTLTDTFTKVTATIPPFHYKSIKVYKGGYYI